jgi:4-hydroxymandelate oxidase
MNPANAATMNVLDEMFTLADFEQVARERMSATAWEYIASGAADETTLRWNREAFASIKLNPRVLVDVAKIDTSVELFGQELTFPIILAPVGLQQLYHPAGEIAAVRGAGQVSATYVVSSYSTTPLEDIAVTATEPLWFQIYLQPDRAFTLDVVQRAEAAGVKAFCVTVDLPVIGVRNRMDRVRFAVPTEMRCPHMMENFTGSPVTWADVEWLRSITRLPVILKGILNPDMLSLRSRTAFRVSSFRTTGLAISTRPRRRSRHCRASLTVSMGEFRCSWTAAFDVERTF